MLSAKLTDIQPKFPITGSDTLPHLSKRRTDNTGQDRNRGHLPWAPSNFAFLTVERDRNREGRRGEWWGGERQRDTGKERHNESDREERDTEREREERGKKHGAKEADKETRF